MSISKQQAAALAEGFLDDLGTSEVGFQPRNTLTEIVLIAGDLVESAQVNLNRSNSVASGSLSESIIANEPEHSGNIVSIEISMNFYGQ